MVMKKLIRAITLIALFLAFVPTWAQTVSPVDFMRFNPYQMNANPATDLPYQSVMSLVIGNIGLDALQALNVDRNGLDDMDIRILSTIIDKFKGGPVGLNTVATAVGEDAGTVEEVYEPYLIQEGYLMRTPRGREATMLAYQHLGKIKQNGNQQELF